MTVTASPSPAIASATSSRVASAAAGVFGVALFLTVASINVPHNVSDSELVAWWNDSGNQLSAVMSGMWAILAAVSFTVVVGHLRRSARASLSPGWRDFATSMGTAVTALWLVTGAARAAIGHLASIIDEPLPGPDVLRFATALNYVLLGVSGMTVLGLFILAVSVLALRSGVLARWIAVTGLFCGGVVVLASIAQYGAYASPVGILWSLCLSVAIWREPTAS